MRLSSEPRSARFDGMTGSRLCMTNAGQGEARWPPPSPISRAFVPPCSAPPHVLHSHGRVPGCSRTRHSREPEP
jgi:hypothetical protein